MRELLRLSPNACEKRIARALGHACRTADLDQIETAAFYVAEVYGVEVAERLNPCRPGSLKSLAYSTGVMVSAVPTNGNPTPPPSDFPAFLRAPSKPPVTDGGRQALALHSSVLATVASFAFILAVVAGAPF